MKNLIEKLLKSEKTHVQLIRYTFVGGIAFVIDFATLYFLTEFLNVYYLASASVAFVFGLIVNYILSIYFVFNKRSLKSKKTEFVIFAIIGVFGLVFNDVSIWFFTEILSLHYLASKIFATVITYLWNFFVRKYSLFK